MLNDCVTLESLHAYMGRVQYGREQFHENLGMVPVLNAAGAPLDHLTVFEALGTGKFTIAEVDAAGSVPELKVINALGRRVLLLDGEELVGARQNRIVNTTMLIKEMSETIIPVSCCEQGRWSYDRPDFVSEQRVMPSAMRSGKSRRVSECLAHSGRYAADQHEIWGEIRAAAGRRRAQSGSMAMKAIFEKDQAALDAYRRGLCAAPEQVGALFLINGYIAGFDCFGCADMFQRQFPKLVDSYALDAIDRLGRQATEPAARDKAVWMAREIIRAAASCRPAVGLGTDVRFESDSVQGFALVHEAVPVHVCAFRKK